MRFPARICLWIACAALLAIVTACSDERAVTPSGPPLLVAIGASDGVGTGARNPSTEGWVAQLRTMIAPQARLANLSIPSMRVQQALDQALPVAIDLKPDVVAIWLAVNDLADGVPLEAYRADLDALLGALERETQARVYVANLPDLTLLPAFRGRDAAGLDAQVRRWNEAIADTVAARGGVLVDLYGGWAELKDHPNYISRDGLHPSTAGHQRLAELFRQAMQVGR